MMARKKTRNNDEEAPQEQRKRGKRINVDAMTGGQKNYIMEILNNRITFCIGPAGTGKTAIAVGLGLKSILAAKPAYKKLIVMRPAKEACGESLGFLPGDLDDKMGP
jgi:phosphate starvation-inducible PhoH-like protein